MGKERRKRERFPLDQEIELSTSEGDIVRTQGINLSEGGLLCRADIEIPKGTLVKFELTIPTGKTSMCISCEGFVLRCAETDGKYNIVIDFTDQDCVE